VVGWNDSIDPFCDKAMWNISSNDVERAKDSIKLRRSEIEARYAEQKEALDAEFAVIETLERAASEFSLKHNRAEFEPASEATLPSETGMNDGTDEKPHSRWRLHLGKGPTDLDGSISNLPSGTR
jgi:hypothetical protein